MADSQSTIYRRWRLERLLLVPVIGALIAVWGIAVGFKLIERRTELDGARTQLTRTVENLSDISELASKQQGESHDERTQDRTAAIWRALVEYPTASFWVETNARIVDGQPPTGAFKPYIFVESRHGDTAVHAALPEADALAAWRFEALWGSGILVAVTMALLLLAYRLSQSVRRRNDAEASANLERHRTEQLTAFQGELTKTVSDRTQDLRDANARLQTELHERHIAQEMLREHDALLKAVTESASELLGSRRFEDVLAAVLELIGRTIAVARVQLTSIATDRDGHQRAELVQEWCAAGQRPVSDIPGLRCTDLTVSFPKTIAPAMGGRHHSSFVTDIPEICRQQYIDAQMQSFLQIPVMIERKLWGLLTFVDSTAAPRSWSWAETDALATLAGLIGVAVIRARYVKDLADANMIVQNSPTILFRLSGEPSLPLTYISPNITKFGHDPAKLLAAANWSELLIDAKDTAKFAEAMARVLQKGSTGGVIEFRLRTGDDDRRWVEYRYNPIRDKLGRLAEIEGIIIDVTERKIAEDKVAFLARTDGLTGLANRTTFVERLRQAFAATKRGASPFAVLYMDLDHFKDVNDTLGHPAGDVLLKEVAERLKINTRESDLVARLGGDEFAILQTEMDDPARAGELATKLLRALSEPYEMFGNKAQVTASIGIATSGPDTQDQDVMLSQADLALYRAKEQGRNQFRFHSDDLDLRVRERVSLTRELRDALEQGQLELRYQVQADIHSGTIVGLEALLHWRHPTRGLLVSGDFLPFVEQSGVMVPLGDWVLDHVCEQIRNWHEGGIDPQVVTISLSLAQVRNARSLVQSVVHALGKWRLQGRDLEFDVTEATLAQLKWAGNDVLTQLRRLGASIAIDEFGSDYSSFDYLKSYGINRLKIAHSLVAKAISDPERAQMIRVIIGLARDLGIGVVAEGVETEEQRALLIATGSPAKGQSYDFGEPVEAVRAAEVLLERRNDRQGAQFRASDTGAMKPSRAPPAMKVART